MHALGFVHLMYSVSRKHLLGFRFPSAVSGCFHHPLTDRHTLCWWCGWRWRRLCNEIREFAVYLKPEQTQAKRSCTSEIHKDNSRLQPANYDNTLFKWWKNSLNEKVTFKTFSVFVSLMLQAVKWMKSTRNLQNKYKRLRYLQYTAHTSYYIHVKSVWLGLDCG